MKRILYIVCLISIYVSGQNTLYIGDDFKKAFPTAYGFGSNADYGRGTADVYFVTNLNASGVGSLQYGLDNAPAGGRVIILRVAGWIDHGLNDYLTVSNPKIYIAGQTAPGGGIGIRGETRVFDDDIIIRHVSMRNDDAHGVDSQAALRIAAYGGATSENIMIDHVSMGWAADENLTITSTNNSGFVNNVTIQNTIIDNNLNTGYGAIQYWNATNITYYQMLTAYTTQRNPTHSTTCDGSFELINSMSYSYTDDALIVAWGVDFDVVGNHFDSGGNTPQYGTAVIQINDPSTANCENLGKTDPGLSGTDVYYDDNLYNGSAGSVDSNTASRLQPSRVVDSGIIPYAASGVRDSIVANAGAYNGLDQGLNSFDTSILSAVENQTGGSRLTSRTYPTDFPTLASGTAYTDSDSDGLSDAYELAQGGTTTSINRNDRPASVTLSNGKVVNQERDMTNYATEGLTHLDFFLSDMANDFQKFSFSPASNPSNGKGIKSSTLRINSGSTIIKGN